MKNAGDISSAKLGLADLTATPKAIIYDGVGAVIEGHRGVLFFDETKVIFRRKNGSISVFGKELKIEEICDGDAFVSGVIENVTFEVKARKVNV